MQKSAEGYPAVEKVQSKEDSHLDDFLAQHRSLRAFIHNKAGLLGMVILLGLILTAALAPVLAPLDPVRVSLANRLEPPFTSTNMGQRYILGTDHLGRDILSRIIYGIRTSLVVGLVCSLSAAVLGTVLGLVAGRGGVTGDVIMRLADIQLAFPFLVLAIAFISLVGSSLELLIILLIIWSWPSFARVTRADTLAVTKREFIMAARAVGASPARLLLRHILPNVISSPLVIWSFVLAQLIIVESSLSFLGLGVPPPTPTLGVMLNDGRGYLDTAWWLATFPGLVISMIVLAVNFVGDALHDALNPKLFL